MSKEPAPKGLVELTVCKCKNSRCKRSDVYPCRANEMSCTKPCLCVNGNKCNNQVLIIIIFIEETFSQTWFNISKRTKNMKFIKHLAPSQVMKTIADQTICDSLLSPTMCLSVLRVCQVIVF